jgi:Ser/Thr protein kinase RdoA (MazF antagonist)
MHPSQTLPVLDFATAWGLLGEPIESIQPIGDGTRSRVYRVHTTDGDVRIVQIVPSGTGRVARERWVRSRLQNTIVQTIPVVVARHTLGDHVDVLLMRDVHAVSLDLALRKSTFEQTQQLWRTFGEQLAFLHSVSIEGFGLLDGDGKGSSTSWRTYAERLAALALIDARASELNDLCDKASERLQALAPSLHRVEDAKLIHGDAGVFNLLCRDHHLVAWIDFEYASGADPLYEFVSVATRFNPEEHPGDEVSRTQAKEAFVRGYHSQIPITVEDPERVAYYQLVHALRRGEFLRVVGPTLRDSERQTAIKTCRDSLQRALI